MPCWVARECVTLASYRTRIRANMSRSEQMSSMKELAEQYRLSVGRLLGPAQFALAHSWNESSPEVWRVSGRESHYALKVHRTANKYTQEREAYARWLPGLDGFASHAPELMACFDDAPGALLMSWINGDIMSRVTLTREQESTLYEQAGHCLAKLHRAQVGLELIATHHDKVRRKAAARAEALREIIGKDVSDWALTMIDLDAWDRIPVGYCHRDYSPRNWMVSLGKDGWRLSVIDFEHADVDHLPVDVMKLWDGPFIGHAERSSAFYRGYGIDEEEHVTAVRLLAVSHGLAIVNWSFGDRRSRLPSTWAGILDALLAR